jgi:hypothetical protein
MIPEIRQPQWRAAQVPPSGKTQFLTEFDKFSPEA